MRSLNVVMKNSPPVCQIGEEQEAGRAHRHSKPTAGAGHTQVRNSRIA
jgi:hypothetical protein